METATKEKTLEIHQLSGKGTGSELALSGDRGSVQMIWNNISGTNFDNPHEHMVYLETVVFACGSKGGMNCKRSLFILMEDGKKIETYGENGAFRGVGFPYAKKFEDLFTLIGKSKEYPVGQWAPNRQGEGIMQLLGMDVKLSDKLIEYIKERMVYGLIGDSYYFETYADEYGKTRIHIKYNKILGSRCLGYIDTDSIPKAEETKSSCPIEAVLSECRTTADGKVVRLPDTQLDKKTYAGVKLKLEKIGGKWNTQAGAFVFQKDARELLERVKDGENVNIQKEFQFFETPSTLAGKVVKMADIKEKHLSLEPSAGRGRIAELMSGEVHVCEFMKDNAEYLKGKYEIVGTDFLEYEAAGVYDRIVANPPFTKNQDIDHVMHMFDCLKSGGRLVSIMSTSWVNGNQNKQKEFRAFLEKMDAHTEEFEAGEFKESGTSIATMIVMIDKP